MLISPIGFVWYKSENDYNKLKSLSSDKDSLPDTFDDWLSKAENGFDILKAKGKMVEKVYLDPDIFIIWCRDRGLNIDAKARNKFVNEFLGIKYKPRN